MSSRPSSTHGQSGFTLIEILLGLTLLAIVLGVIQGVYSGVIRSRDRIQEQTEQSHSAALLLHLMADELVSSVPPSTNPGGQDYSISLEPDGNLDSKLEFSAFLPPLLQEGEDAARGGVARVAYRLEKAEDGTLDVLRTDSRVAAGAAGSQAGHDDKGDPLLRGVSRFRVKLLGDGDNWKDSSGATSTTGSTGQAMVWRAVSIEIAWKEGKKGEGERVLRTMVPLLAVQ